MDHQQQQEQQRRNLGNSFRDRLKDVCRETKSYFQEIIDYVPEVADNVKRTVLYTHTIPSPPVPISEQYDTQFKVIYGDTIDIAIQLLEDENMKPLVLNMASPFKPGGGWENGSMAQEESLFYRSTYDVSLSDPFNLDPDRKWHYPIPFTGAIYSPNVFVFRGNLRTGFPVWHYKNCVFLDFIAVAAIKNPFVGPNGRLSYQDSSFTKKKIRTMLRVAYDNGHNDILLGAFGCGAFHNPPVHIADLFCQVFREKEFVGRFKRIYFAILDGKNENNYNIFKEHIEKLNDEKVMKDEENKVGEKKDAEKGKEQKLEEEDEKKEQNEDDEEDEKKEKVPLRRRCSI